MKVTIQNPFSPADDRGQKLHAHGGHIIQDKGWYYWVGEDRTGRNKISCYRSKNLTDWTFCNHILTLDSPFLKYYVNSAPELNISGRQGSIGQGCTIERPKVIYNRKTGKYVLWMHWELPDNYKEARCAVAICDTIDGDYTYLGSFNPIGHMSRDCTLFVDEDDTAHFISTSRYNQDLHIYKLSEDYLSIDRLARVLWPGQSQEAPTLFKREGLYYLLTSGCTGWTPNQSSYAYSTAIDGDWSPRFNFGDSTTYASQPTCVLPIAVDRKTDYYYIGDRWGGDGELYYHSAAIILPIQFGPDNTLAIDWQQKLTITLPE